MHVQCTCSYIDHACLWCVVCKNNATDDVFCIDFRCSSFEWICVSMSYFGLHSHLLLTGLHFQRSATYAITTEYSLSSTTCEFKYCVECMQHTCSKHLYAQLHSSAEGSSSTTNPQPKRNHPSACSGTVAHCYPIIILMQRQSHLPNLGPWGDRLKSPMGLFLPTYGQQNTCS